MKKIIGFILIGVVLGGLAGYGIIRHLAIKRTKAEIATLVVDMPAVRALDYKKLSVGLIDSSLDMKDIRIELTDYGEPLTIDRLHLQVNDPAQRIPPEATARIKGIHLSTQHPLMEPFRTDLEAMGYKEINGLITISYSYDKTKKHLNLNNVTIEAEKMGSVTLELSLTNLDLEQLIGDKSLPDISAILVSMPMTGLANGSVTYSDNSFFNRISQISTQPSEAASERRQQLKNWLNKNLNTEKNERVRRIQAVLSEFIDDPKAITLAFQPPNPVPFLRLFWIKKPVDLFDLLNVTVSS